MRSFVWNHFKKTEQGGAAICLVNNCEKVLQCKGSSTRGMISHLKARHGITEENTGDTKQEGAGFEGKK